MPRAMAMSIRRSTRTAAASTRDWSTGPISASPSWISPARRSTCVTSTRTAMSTRKRRSSSRQMTTKNDLDERFARAVALFNAGKLLQAEALFRAIAAGSYTLAEKANNYLSRIATLLSPAQSITEPPKFKRRKSAKRAAKKPTTLRFKKAAAPKFNQRKSAKRAAGKSEAAPKRAAKKREAAPKRAAKKAEA